MKIISLICMVWLLFAIECAAQSAVAIDVTALTIQKPYVSSSLVTLTADGLPAPFQSPLTGGGGGIMNTLESCRSCFLGASLNTGFGWDGGANWFSGFAIGGYGNGKTVKFYLVGSSPQIFLAPTIRQKIARVFLTAPAEIHGKIEIYDGNTLIAFDDDVNLTGSLTAEFGQYRATRTGGDRRAFDFSKITYSYAR